MLKTGTSEIAYITDREDGQESLAGGYPVMADGQVRWRRIGNEQDPAKERVWSAGG